MNVSQLYTFISNTPWTSWISHGLVAALLATVVGHPFAIGAFYVLRECEQVSLELVYKKPVDVQDHIMDALVPVTVLLVLGWLT